MKTSWFVNSKVCLGVVSVKADRNVATGGCSGLALTGPTALALRLVLVPWACL